ncbi:peroxiredoxin, partial [Caldisphaera sp.]
MSNEKIKVGSKAPLFEAIADNGEKISLANYIGKYNIVLYFYPKDFTPGCTKEACSFRDNWDKLKDYNAIVIGISSDNLETHKRFKEKYKIPFILLSDSKKEIRKKYNAEGFI